MRDLLYNKGMKKSFLGKYLSKTMWLVLPLAIAIFGAYFYTTSGGAGGTNFEGENSMKKPSPTPTVKASIKAKVY